MTEGGNVGRERERKIERAGVLYLSCDNGQRSHIE